MANLANLTPFAARLLHSIDKEGAERLVVCIAGRFDMPKPGQSVSGRLRPAVKQVPPPVQDVFWGEPGLSSLRYETQSTYYRPGTDIYLNGHARPPDRRPVKEMTVRLEVGPCKKEVLVIGDRTWGGGILGLGASAPRAFDAMPLVYERSFGGNLPKEAGRNAEMEPRNPVGRGLYRDASEAEGQPLPNLEDPKRPVRSWSDRPAPVGFGAVFRAWQPRVALAGTYDSRWLEERCPLWPLDLDLRHFQGAAPGLVATPYLKGGEPVRIEGVSPDGVIEFRVPHHRLTFKSVFRDRVDVQAPVIDGLLLEPDDAAVTLFWRASHPVRKELPRHEYSVVRELEPWEEEPR
ncbi:MAG: DUF2169 domain-containing protein [Isosphaeraceae bacterium]